MAELPGWDRARLATAPGPDVEAARWIVYGRVLAPEIHFDYPGAMHSLDLADMKPESEERARRADRKIARQQLRAAAERQQAYRRLLRLDEPDDAEESTDG